MKVERFGPEVVERPEMVELEVVVLFVAKEAVEHSDCSSVADKSVQRVDSFDQLMVVAGKLGHL